MKTRMPNTIEDAITIIAGHIGYSEAANAIGKSESLIRKMGDPDHSLLPNIEQVMLLDAAYQALTGDTPLLAFYQRTMERHARILKKQSGDSGEDLSHCVLGATEAVGALAAKVRECTQKNSDGGSNITPNELAQIARVGELMREKYELFVDLIHPAPQLAKG